MRFFQKEKTLPEPKLVFAWLPVHVWNINVWGYVWLEKVVKYKLDAQSSFWHYSTPETYTWLNEK